MKKNQIALLVSTCSLIVIVIVLFFLWAFGFLPCHYTKVTVSLISINPESWLGKRVEVQGTLQIGLIHVPEQVPPYNCLLQDTNEHTAIGVLWRRVDLHLSGMNVIIMGIVRKGETGPLIIKTVYYIEAEIVRAT